MRLYWTGRVDWMVVLQIGVVKGGRQQGAGIDVRLLIDDWSLRMSVSSKLDLVRHQEAATAGPVPSDRLVRRVGAKIRRCPAGPMLAP